jgi:hypothetical protein
MVYGLLLVATFVFFEAFVRLGTLAPMRTVLSAGPEGLRTISSSMISDDEKERVVRQLSKQMLRATTEMILKATLATAAAGLVLWLGAELFSVPLEELESAILSLPVIAGLVVVALGYARIRHVLF